MDGRFSGPKKQTGRTALGGAHLSITVYVVSQPILSKWDAGFVAILELPLIYGQSPLRVPANRLAALQIQTGKQR